MSIVCEWLQFCAKLTRSQLSRTETYNYNQGKRVPDWYNACSQVRSNIVSPSDNIIAYYKGISSDLTFLATK
ncbi:hypothetical protein QTP88_024625 [Uroleucon formosanum]